ncbi:hypothetical protein EVAR_16271_1 [Eumeta japonica]|uniref:Uncharacterized protein n=1 Tax=Eumeta variegata TaxID=151549 RepID=A0A4C1U5Z3_EUMVA|nr:hypothetical protein EVAR_16271_1 [Eumeta japonica]
MFIRLRRLLCQLIGCTRVKALPALLRGVTERINKRKCVEFVLAPAPLSGIELPLIDTHHATASKDFGAAELENSLRALRGKFDAQVNMESGCKKVKSRVSRDCWPACSRLPLSIVCGAQSACLQVTFFTPVYTTPVSPVYSYPMMPINKTNILHFIQSRHSLSAKGASAAGGARAVRQFELRETAVNGAGEVLRRHTA